MILFYYFSNQTKHPESQALNHSTEMKISEYVINTLITLLHYVRKTINYENEIFLHVTNILRNSK